MIRRLYDRLPGPTPAKVTIAVVLVLVVLVLLGFVFEQAGGLLDSGGVIELATKYRDVRNRIPRHSH